jgi:3-hydroxyacyl-CoA dehydrogenase
MGNPADEVGRATADRNRRVAILGSGTIGTGWAASFAAAGWQVRLFDTDRSRRAATLQEIGRVVRTVLNATSRDSGSKGTWAWSESLEEALDGADFVQESAPDVVDIKRALLTAASRLVDARVPIASSTSTFRPSELQVGLPRPERILVGHPFHPVYLIPLVEVVGGEATQETALARSEEIYAGLGKTVIRLKREVIGHLVNRLQAAMIREAVSLVDSGVATVHDVDRGVAYAPALRWPLSGIFMTLHLAGGAGGGREYLEKLGPSLETMWRDLGNPRLSPQVREEIARQLSSEYGDRPLNELVAERDRLLTQFVSALTHSGRLV